MKLRPPQPVQKSNVTVGLNETFDMFLCSCCRSSSYKIESFLLTATLDTGLKRGLTSWMNCPKPTLLHHLKCHATSSNYTFLTIEVSIRFCLVKCKLPVPALDNEKRVWEVSKWRCIRSFSFSFLCSFNSCMCDNCKCFNY